MHRQNDWPIITQLRDCNGPRKEKAHAHIVSKPFPPSSSKLLRDVLIGTVEKLMLNPFRAPEPLPILNPSNFVPKNGLPVVKGEYYLEQAVFSVSYKVSTARQLRISTGGNTGRTNLSQRSYSNKLCSTKNAYEYLFHKEGAKTHEDCRFYALQRTTSIRQLIVVCVF